MPKGKKRTQADYEREAENAVKRFKKNPEFLQSVSSSVKFKKFLKDIGVHEENIENGDNYWEIVREKANKIIPIEWHGKKIDISELYAIHDNRTVYKEIKQDKSVYIEVYSEKKIVYRSATTGKFISKTS